MQPHLLAKLRIEGYCQRLREPFHSFVSIADTHAWDGDKGRHSYLQSTRRLARESAENPPNTTLWIAPMRAHASIAIGSASVAGMYSATASPCRFLRNDTVPMQSFFSTASHLMQHLMHRISLR